MGTAREMALAAQNAGADAVMVHQPVHPYLMTEGLIRYYAGIARSVEIGVVLYARHEAIDREVLSRVAAAPLGQASSGARQFHFWETPLAH